MQCSWIDTGQHHVANNNKERTSFLMHLEVGLITRFLVFIPMMSAHIDHFAYVQWIRQCSTCILPAERIVGEVQTCLHLSYYYTILLCWLLLLTKYQVSVRSILNLQTPNNTLSDHKHWVDFTNITSFSMSALSI